VPRPKASPSPTTDSLRSPTATSHRCIRTKPFAR
jgi:hypothetical protein